LFTPAAPMLKRKPPVFAKRRLPALTVVFSV